MKKTLLFLTLIVIVLLSYSDAYADMFNLISSSFSIQGSLQATSVGGSPGDLYSESYDISSGQPIADKLSYIDIGPGLVSNYEYFAASSASYNYLYAETSDNVPGHSSTLGYPDVPAIAIATATLIFQPTFSGLSSGIAFTAQRGYLCGYGHITLTDITTSEVITSASLYGVHSWDVPVGGLYWGGLGNSIFTYDAWNPDHEYQLTMDISAYNYNTLNEGPPLSTLTTDMAFNVPEPSTILLLCSGLILVALGLKRRRNKLR